MDQEEDYYYDEDDAPLGYTRRPVFGEWDSDDDITALAWRKFNVRDAFLGRFGQAEQKEATNLTSW